MDSFRSRSRAAKAYDLLPPDKGRSRAVLERMARPFDVEDAEFVVIREAERSDPRTANPVNRTIRPGNDNGYPRAAGLLPTERDSAARPVFARGLEAGESLLGRLSENLFSLLVAFVFVAVFALAGGLLGFAHSGGQTSRDPVGFSHVTVSPRTVNGIPMMVVNGILENRGPLPLVSPRLRADVYSGAIMLSSTLFDPRLGRIGSGESLAFQVKLPNGGGKTPEVRLSLAD